eukprot:2675030-Alexandrium_andersonii.AAC.1
MPLGPRGLFCGFPRSKKRSAVGLSDRLRAGPGWGSASRFASGAKAALSRAKLWCLRNRLLSANAKWVSANGWQ